MTQPLRPDDRRHHIVRNPAAAATLFAGWGPRLGR
jgi:hypothetical protein